MSNLSTRKKSAKKKKEKVEKTKQISLRFYSTCPVLCGWECAIHSFVCSAVVIVNERGL